MNNMQIDRLNCMEIILQEFPAFQNRWDGYLESWTPFIPRPIALDVAEFADFSLELIGGGVDAELDRLAATIELILANGDSIINYTIRMMLLKNIAQHGKIDRYSTDRFIAKLQPITSCYFNYESNDWAGKNYEVEKSGNLGE